jgi:L-seryl-tRNA(Ser) seleniumtransferase
LRAADFPEYKAWKVRDHDGIRPREQAALDLWMSELSGLEGIDVRIIPDPTGNPLDRLKIRVLPESGYTANGLANALAQGAPPIMVRSHEVERGHFFLDPCNLHPGEEVFVAGQIVAHVAQPERAPAAMARPVKSVFGVLNWPD